MIAAAKFRGREELAAAAGRLLAADSEAGTLVAGVSAVVPVPLGRRRRRQRGYNQAAVIARALGRTHRRPVVYALRRTRETSPQSDLPLLSRAANVDGAFAPLRQVSGRVALVDDVVTSGQTACAAARALLEAGASDVVVLAVARAV
jgi:ComF family protein